MVVSKVQKLVDCSVGSLVVMKVYSMVAKMVELWVDYLENSKVACSAGLKVAHSVDLMVQM